MKSRILILTDYYYPHWTGISKSIGYIAEYLVQNSFPTTVLTTRFKNELQSNENKNGVTIIRVPYQFSLSRAKYSLSLLWKSISFIKKSDIVIINSPFTQVLPCSIVTKIFQKRLIIFHQGDLILPKGIMNDIIEKIFFVSTYLACRLASVVSTYTDDYATNSPLLKKFLHKFVALLPPIKISTSLNPNSSFSRRLKSITNKYTYVFGFAGRFVEEKGFDILFDAIPLIVKKYPHTHFLFAGQTQMSYEQFFEQNKTKYQSVKKHITLLGLLSDTELITYYQSLLYFIMPSRSDCFGLTQVESILCGTPVIIPNIPGARMLVKESHFGCIFESENPTDLSQKIFEGISKYNEIKENRTKALQLLDSKKNGKKVIQTIRG